jgi:hypothetical protein
VSAPSRGFVVYPLHGVTPSRHDCRMTDDELLREAAFDGFELAERMCQQALGVGLVPVEMTVVGSATSNGARQ